MSGSNSKEYPRITIITPSYNQGHFIEETIRSVLSQGYPNLEYLIIDGGSTDNTIEVIKKYESQIAYWVSEPDRGQTHAINKGLAIATGDILAYINSDDYYLPGTFFKVAEAFQTSPEIDLLHGRCRYINEIGEKMGEQFGNIHQAEEIIDLWGVWWAKQQFVQPEVFWTKRMTQKIGMFNEQLHYVMDYDYWCRILQAEGQVGRLDTEIACFRFTATQKSKHRNQAATELLKLVQPLLWDTSVNLPSKKRLLLQSKWLYQSLFLKEIELSLQQNEPKFTRWMKLLKIIGSQPKILLAPDLRHRFLAVFDRLNPL
jgi:glycosyltransferase involved in cell wall biosynthesis